MGLFSGDRTVQPTRYVFKLRQNITLDGDLLLARLELESFLQSPLVPQDTITAAIHDLYPSLSSIECQTFGHYARPEGIQSFTVVDTLSILPILIRRLSFIQQIFCFTANTPYAQQFLENVLDCCGPVITQEIIDGTLILKAIPHYTLFELGSTAVSRSGNPAETRKNLGGLLSALTGESESQHDYNLAHTGLSARSSTAHLSHDIHYYKAKFFPRLARSMLNICTQMTGLDDCMVIDNFVGSGTTLLEASTLGFPSIGLDIDPLSVLISKAKLDVLHLDPGQLEKASEQILEKLFSYSKINHPESALTFKFPAWLDKNRKMTAALKAELLCEITIAQASSHCPTPASQLFQVLLSDAITRRVRMRFLGTGVGRFSLTLSKSSVPQIFAKSVSKISKVVAAAAWLQETLHINPAPAQVFNEDARNFPNHLGKFDVLLTSPPYLPASSGRESYTMARVLPLLALDLVQAGDLDQLTGDAIGSMKNGNTNLKELTVKERTLVDWLQNDALRSIKAEPTARYFLDMRRSLQQMRLFMKPGAILALVSGKQSTFYEFSSRKTLFVAESADLLAEEAVRSGFELEAMHDIQLLKSNMNARPRSLDDYFETIILLRNPD